MALTKEAIAAAREAGTRLGPVAVAARYRPALRKLEVSYDNGVTLAIPVALIEGLQDASAEALAEIEISPAGSGLHFPALDADVYVPALLEGIYGTKAWMRRLGMQRSPAKAAASRENGKKGGRPRKPPLPAHA